MTLCLDPFLFGRMKSLRPWRESVKPLKTFVNPSVAEGLEGGGKALHFKGRDKKPTDLGH